MARGITVTLLGGFLMVAGGGGNPAPSGDEPRPAAEVAAQEKELADIERQIAAKQKELADLRARADALRAAIGKAKPPAIVGAWDVTSHHTTQAGLFQLTWGARRRESNVRFEQAGDRLTGHVVSTERGGVKGEPIVFRTLRFSGDRLVFEFDIKGWDPGSGPIAVESGRLPNKGMLRAEARLTGDRLVGTWGLFTVDGAEVFRGEWEANRAKEVQKK